MLEQLGNLAGAGLGQLGGILSAPRKALLGLVNSGASALGLGEVLPEDGGSFTSKLGMDPESVWSKALGFGYETLTDPLTYLGGTLAKGAGKALGFGSEAAGAANSGAKTLSAGSDVAQTGISSLKPLRQQFTVLKGSKIEPPTKWDISRGDLAGYDLPAKAVGPLNVDSAIAERAHDMFKALQPEGMKGSYFPAMTDDVRSRIKAAGRVPVEKVALGVDRTAQRHETVHGMIDALRAGIPSPNAPMIMRVPARLQQSQNPFIRGLGEIGDELAAHTLMEKGLSNRVRNGSKFLFSGHPAYVDQISQINPLAAELYRYGLMGAGATGGAGIGAGVGGLFGGDR